MSAFRFGSKVWKERPPGPEQLLLDQMFQNGSVNAAVTPDSVRQSSEVFMQFSAKVFAAHFRKTKARLGEFVSNVRIPEFPGGVIPPDVDDISASGISQIPELGLNESPSILKKPRLGKPETTEKTQPGEIINPPYGLWRYTDHTLKNDFVCVTVNIFTGCKSVSFDVTEDGLKVIIRFTWSNAMFTPTKMFNEAIRNRTTSLEHPMLHAMATTFLESGITENSKNEGQWVIPLPCRVRREVSSYSMTQLTYETTKMVFIKLTAYQHDVIIEQANRTLDLE